MIYAFFRIGQSVRRAFVLHSGHIDIYHEGVLIMEFKEWSMDHEQSCPICGTAVAYEPRYPQYICATCAENPVDKIGRSLVFYNSSMASPFKGIYLDNKEETDNDICYLKGVKCRASEGRFGGIIYQTVDG